jgi:predicted dehydrogenase
MNVAIIGCGLIGRKRSEALAGCRLVACADLAFDEAEILSRRFPGCQPYQDWHGVLDRKDVEIVIVATPHQSLAEITLAAVSSRKHVLVEKPAARHVQELDPVILAAEKSGSRVRVGFNHRYHRALRRAREIFETGELGELMFVRARYGHGGRIGYNKEWRARPELSGGGELIDQGVHIIDLARWFLGDFSEAQGSAHTYFWDMPVDDNAFLLLKTVKQQTAFLHVSCTEWKNLFSFEIYGKRGKIHIEGLGGSYGVERLAYYKMLPQMGPPETMIWEYPMADDSWSVEFSEFLQDLRLGRQPVVGLADARAVLKIVDKIYKDSGYDHHA